jgi:hypothetical protein
MEETVKEQVEGGLWHEVEGGLWHEVEETKLLDTLDLL